MNSSKADNASIKNRWRKAPRFDFTDQGSGIGPARFSSLREYYQNPRVQERINEFLGGTAVCRPTAVYITGGDGTSEINPPASISQLREYLGAGLEIERSLWDESSLIADIDIEYENFDFPTEPWLHPARAFALQQPVLNATLDFLRISGIHPLILVSGRGFHLVWRVSRNSSAFTRLVRLGRIPPSLEARYFEARSPEGQNVPADLGRAFAGLGLVLEFVAHHVAAASRDASSVPVQITAIEVGPGEHGREIVSIDLSEYGDPLHSRHIRVPFSAYLKPRRFEWALGGPGIDRLLPILAIPLGDMALADALTTMRSLDGAADFAGRCSTGIPDLSRAMETLLDAYECSELAKFHHEFYRRPWADESKGIPRPIYGAPSCVTGLLENPNDRLLKPAALQHVVRVLTALGWEPRDIAQVIYASYCRDCDWGELWARLEPFNRAIFYTRLFTGMIATGVDQLIDLNCVSQKEKGYCTISECSSNLADYQQMLLRRRLK